MNETPQQENVVDISTAKSFGNPSTKALSTLSTMQKVVKRRSPRNTEQSQGREHFGPRELCGPMSQLSFLDNDTPQAGPGRRVAGSELVEKIIKDLEQVREVYKRHADHDVVHGMTMAIELIKDEYL
jgi:hypothetical protein